MPFGSLQPMLFPLHIPKNFCHKRIKIGCHSCLYFYILYVLIKIVLQSWNRPCCNARLNNTCISFSIMFGLANFNICSLRKTDFLKSFKSMLSSNDGSIYEREWAIAHHLAIWLYRFLQYVHKCYKSYHYYQHTSKILNWLAMSTLLYPRSYYISEPYELRGIGWKNVYKRILIVVRDGTNN